MLTSSIIFSPINDFIYSSFASACLTFNTNNFKSMVFKTLSRSCGDRYTPSRDDHFINLPQASFVIPYDRGFPRSTLGRVNS